MEIIALDLECTTDGPKNSPEAHYLNNRVLLCGWYHSAVGMVTINDDVNELIDYAKSLVEEGKQVLFVGHNLKFDLKYLMRDRPDFPWEKADVWCTQYTQYRLSGHQTRFISLEDIADYYGIPFQKSLDLGALIKAGIRMEDIDRDELAEYLEEDVLTTLRVHTQQANRNSNLIFQNHLLVLSDMELNGLPIDKLKLRVRQQNAIIHSDEAEETLRSTLNDYLEWSNGDDILDKHCKPTAPRTLSYLLTGEPAAGLTKLKTKGIDFKKGKGPILPSKTINKIWGRKKATHLGYSLSKKEIDAIKTYGNNAAIGLVESLEEYRKWYKLLGTYYAPFAVEMAASGQDSIYPKLNPAVTATGRTSSSNPNGQNMPGEVRSLVQATHRAIFELDFSQLEVVALATLSQDAQLITDIQNGQDLHFHTGKTVMGWKTPSDMTKKERTLVKNVNFGLIYGGTAAGLAYQTGQPVQMVKDLIDAFYARYPGVQAWQKKVYTEVVQNMKPEGHLKGEQYYSSMYTEALTGRIFKFTEGEAPPWLKKKTGRGFSFKPTETKNYPVQGFAGGDIVMVALWKFWTILRPREQTWFRITVHDSIVIDSDETKEVVEDAMTHACRYVETIYNLPVLLKFDVDTGHNWS